MRNASPLTALVGIPGRWPNSSGYTAEIAATIASHASFDRAGEEALLLDGETRTLHGRVQYSVGERFHVGLQLPWIHHSGGFMDGIIDKWHEMTGLDEGIRPQTGRNDLRYIYERGDARLLALDDDTSGFGDLQIGTATKLGTLSGRVPVTLTAGVDLPTGDADKLTGNGNVDFNAGLRIESPGSSGDPLAWWLDAGLVWPGDADVPGLITSGQIFYYDAAVAWRAVRRIDLLLQIAGHSAPYQSGAELIGEPALQMAAGVLWHISDRYAIRAGFYEDLRAETAPDFGLEATLIFKGTR